MMSDGLTAADVMAITKNNDDYGMNGIWNNPFIYFVWMALFGGGLFGNRYGDAASQGALTRAELADGLGRQDILRNQDVIQTELSSFERDAANKWGDIRYDNLKNTYDLQTVTTAGFAGVEKALCDNRFAQQECCCATNRNIDDVKAEAYKNTCAITNAIHGEGELTRALITQNTMQELRDKLADRDRDLLAAEQQLLLYNQTGALIEAIRPVSKPAYITCSPYTSNTCGTPTYGSCGCGL